MSLISNISSDYVSDILDEIALEGLDGITIEALWKRLSVRPNFCFKIDNDSKNFIWKIVIQLKPIRYYELPEPRAPLIHYVCSPDTENQEAILELDKVYPYCKLKNVTEVFGSCKYYFTRIDITDEVVKLKLNEIEEKWGNKLVIVASQDIRTYSLIGNLSTSNIDFSKCSIHYDILERIGRSRYFGLATCGKGSIQSVVEDCKSIFHYLKFLHQHKLIKKQSVFGSLNGSANAFKIHLNRFYELCLNDNLSILKTAIEELKLRPLCAMPSDEFNALFDQKRRTRLKKFRKTVVFRKYISVTSNIPYCKLYPNSSPSDSEKKAKNGEKMIRCAQLINPNVQFVDIIERECEVDDEESNFGILPKGIYYENMPINAQALHHIKNSGASGLSHQDLAQKMGLTKHFIRGLINKLYSEKHIQFYFENDGRKRSKRYIVGENIQNKTAASEIVQILSEPISTKKIPDAKENVTENENKIPKEPVNIPQLKEENMSYRSLRRIGMIIKTIKAHRYRLLHQIFKYVNQEEIEEGVTSKVDRHTIKRMLKKLGEDGLIKVIPLTEQDKTGQTVYLYTDPAFEPDEKQLNSLRQIHSSFNTTELKKVVEEDFGDLENAYAKVLADNYTEMKKMLNGIVRKPDKPSQASLKQSELLYSPKFIRLSILHDFIFHLVYDYTGISEKSQEEMIEELSKTTAIDDDLKNEISQLYGTQLSTYMFVPPINRIDNMDGWFLLSDVLTRLPLSIIVKAVKVSETCPELWKYLHHPVRKHFLIKNLPLSVRQIFFDRKYQLSTIYNDFRRLCFIGLIQFGIKFGREQHQTLAYLNRKASLLDTSTSPAEYYQVPSDMTFDVKSYYFETKTDVKKYWMDMFNICMATNLGCKTKVIGKEIFMERESAKESFKKAIEPKPVAKVMENDNGVIPGDNLGAAGLDSGMFSFLRSNWSGPVKKPMDEIKKKKVLKMPIQKIKKEQIMNNLYKSRTCRKKVLSKVETINSVISNEKPKSSRIRKIKERECKVKRKRNISYDEIDLEALRLMSTLRVTWSTAEDNFLLICRVAMMFLCPNSRMFVRIPWVEVRKVLQENFAESRNKTQKAVARRIIYMMKNPTTLRSVNLCLEELKQMPEASTKFDCTQLLNSIKPSHPQLVELQNQLYEKFRELVLFLKDRFIDCKNFNGKKKNTEIIPDTIQEFFDKYQMEVPEEHPITVKSIRENVIRAILMSSLSCRADKTSSALQLFDIYRQYNDDELHKVIRKLQRDKVITVSKKAGNAIFKEGKVLPLSFSPYKLSFAFQHMLNMKYGHAIYSESFLQINKLLDSNEQSEFEVDLNECNVTLFLLASRELVSFQTIFPDQIVVLDPGHFSDATYSKILERYCEMLRYSGPNLKFVCSSGKILSKPSGREVIKVNGKKKKRINENSDSNVVNSKKIKLETPTNYDDDEEEEEGEEEDEEEEEGEVVVGEEEYEEEEHKNRENTTVDDKPIEKKTEKKQIGSEKTTRSSRVILYMMREEAKKEANNDSNRFAYEFCVVNASKILSKINKYGLQKYCNESGPKSVSIIIKNIMNRLSVPITLTNEKLTVENFKVENEIENVQKTLDFICSKKEHGVTNAELKMNCKSDILHEIVQYLLNEKVIIKSGISETRYISQKYCSPWLLNSFKMKRLEKEKIKPIEINAVALDDALNNSQNSNDEVPRKKMKGVISLQKIKTDEYTSPACSNDINNKIKIIIKPWIRIDGSLNRKVLDRFLGAVLSFIMSNPGISIKAIMDKFSPSITPIWTKDLVEILLEIGCVTLTSLIVKEKASLFSKSVILVSDSYTGLEDDDLVAVEAKVDAITSLGLFIGKKNYAKDFLVD